MDNRTHNDIHVLVTGANGFLGSNIVRIALDNGINVTASDISEEPLYPYMRYYRADILEGNSLQSIFYDVDVVVHAAGLAHVFGKSQKDKAPFYEVNAIGTANVAKAAGENGVKLFILISSVAVYGKSMSKDISVCNPIGYYAKSKLQAEQFAIDIARSSGMDLVIMRLATLYGEGDRGNVYRLIRTIDLGHFVWIGKGRNRKSLLFVDDAAKACIDVIRKSETGIRTYNISAPPYYMCEIVDEISKALGKRILPVCISAKLTLLLISFMKRFFDIKNIFSSLYETLTKWLNDDCYSMGDFYEIYNYYPQVNLVDGINREVTWYRNKK